VINNAAFHFPGQYNFSLIGSKSITILGLFQTEYKTANNCAYNTDNDKAEQTKTTTAIPAQP
jgi:hypothetical protein